MARRKKPEKIDPEERARLKRVRALQRREDRKKRRSAGVTKEKKSTFTGIGADETISVRDNFEWIKNSAAKGYAWAIVNSIKDRPYWLSIPIRDGLAPISGFYPCDMFARAGRYYYGFLFQACRDHTFSVWCQGRGARKELTGPNNGPLIS